MCKCDTDIYIYKSSGRNRFSVARENGRMASRKKKKKTASCDRAQTTDVVECTCVYVRARVYNL